MAKTTIPTDNQDGRSVRGAATRQRLLKAGTRIFAEKDYSAVTTRELADAARANQAAIVYHFRNKEGLYLAVAEYVAAQMRSRFASALPGSDSAKHAPSRTGAARQLHEFLRALARGLIAIPEHSAMVEFIMREQAHPGAAFDLLYGSYLGEMHRHATGLVARATNRADGDPEAIADAHAIIGMALAFTVARATFLRRVSRTRYSATQVEQLAKRVADLGCRALGLAESSSHEDALVR